MTNLIEKSNWDEVPQIETNTPLKGGPGGALNGQAQALLNRVAALNDALQLPDYAALRAYSGPRKSVYVTAPGIAGPCVLDPSDTTSPDNGGTCFVTVDGKRFKRAFDGAVDPRWFGAKGDGVADNTAEVTSASSTMRLGKKTFKTSLSEVPHGYLSKDDLLLISPVRRWSQERIEGRALAAPAAMDWTPPIRPIYSAGAWSGHVPARSLFPAVAGVRYYVDPMLGSDANSGLTEALPLKSPSVAIAKPDVGEVLIAPTPWPNNDVRIANCTPTTTAPHIIIRNWPIRQGRYMSTTAWSHTDASWAPDASYPAVYKATRSAVEFVVDFSIRGEHGEPYFYIAVASVPACATRPGTYYTDGVYIWINPLGSGVPGRHVRVLMTGTNFYWNSNKDLYVDGIDVFGGSAFFVRQSTANVVLANVRAGVTLGNAYQIETSGTVILENCGGFSTKQDIFNYHAPNGSTAPNVIEINCWGADGGLADTDSNQISTIHDGGKILRIGGNYSGSRSQVIGDVSDGTVSWNVGVKLCGSRSYGTSNIGAYLSAASGYYYDCDFGESATSLAVVSSGSAYLHRTNPKTNSISDGGSCGAYEQT